MAESDRPVTGDLAVFAAKAEANRRVACKIYHLDFTEQQRADFEAACDANPRVITAHIIAEVLGEWGFPVDYQSVQRHRNKNCSCPKGPLDVG